jgi:UPF0755 protein
MPRDHLGIFGPEETGEFDVDALRAALRSTPDATIAPAGSRAAQAQRRGQRKVSRDRRRRRLRSSVIALVVLLLIGTGTFFLVRSWSTETQAAAPDYPGSGSTEVLIRINGDEPQSAIARTLVDSGVVRSVDSFLQQAAGNTELLAITPGYYKVRKEASSASTIALLLDPQSKVGQVDLRPGLPLDDTTIASTGKIDPGYVTLLTDAACVELNGESDCFTTDDLWNAIRTIPLDQLNLPDWAQAKVSAITDLDRRLEGLIVPGVYDIPPGKDPVAVLRYVFATSAVSWTGTALAIKAKELGLDPYDIIRVASLVEREAIEPDMTKVARVIYNRLDADMLLQLDSTVNYAARQSQVATSDSDRNDSTSPYNTYRHKGLPPTPIGGIGGEALTAALDPASGSWMYFVKVDLDGNSCFTITYEEHLACVEQARAAGVFG